MAKKQTRPSLSQPDLTAAVGQSTVDKLLASVPYPLVLFDQSWPFSGYRIATSGTGDPDYLYSKTQVAALLAGAQNSRSPKEVKRPATLDDQINQEILRSAGTVIESAKQSLAAQQESPSTYSGPDPTLLNKVLAGGVKNLLVAFDDIQFKAHLAWLKIAIADRPTVTLNSPTVGISGLNVLASATGELWWYHPTFHCSSLCLNWSVTWGLDRIAAVTVTDIKIAADAHATLSTDRALVQAQGIFDKLRLNYKILDQIPLEGIANDQMAKQLVPVYDAGKYVASVPVLGSKFAVSAVDVPAANGQLVVNIQIKQI